MLLGSGVQGLSLSFRFVFSRWREPWRVRKALKKPRLPEVPPRLRGRLRAFLEACAHCGAGAEEQPLKLSRQGQVDSLVRSFGVPALNPKP